MPAKAAPRQAGALLRRACMMDMQENTLTAPRAKRERPLGTVVCVGREGHKEQRVGRRQEDIACAFYSSQSARNASRVHASCIWPRSTRAILLQ